MFGALHLIDEPTVLANVDWRILEQAHSGDSSNDEGTTRVCVHCGSDYASERKYVESHGHDYFLARLAFSAPIVIGAFYDRN